MRLSRLYRAASWSATRTILVPRPMTAPWAASRSATPPRFDWLRDLLDAVLLEPVTAT